MRDANHNTEGIQDTVAGRAQQRDVTSLLRANSGREGCSFRASSLQQPAPRTTLGDGHARPSKNAVTRAPSTNVEKLMGTLFDAILRCNVDVTYGAGSELSLSPLPPPLPLLPIPPVFSRHACREKSPANPAASTKTPKLLGTLSSILSDERRPIE